MNWDSIQQVVRILLYAIGGYFLGDAVTEGEAFQAAVGGLLSAVAFIWWLVWERKRPSGVTSLAGAIIFGGAAYIGQAGEPAAAAAFFAMLLVLMVLVLLGSWRERRRE